MTKRPTLMDAVRIGTAMWWLGRGIRALAGIEQIRVERTN